MNPLKCLNSTGVGPVDKILAGLPREAPYPWNMVNLFSCGCHVIDRAYVRTFSFSPCLMRKRITKSEAILALLDTFQELHLEW